jgi:hypothetical protein
MKRILSIALATIVISTIFADIGESAWAESGAQADEIASIRTHYLQINRSTARYQKMKKDLSGFSAEGSVLVAYFDGPNIMKISATFYGESGKAADPPIDVSWHGKSRTRPAQKNQSRKRSFCPTLIGTNQ